MIALKTWQTAGIFLGVGWNLLYGLLFFNFSPFERLERRVYDGLIQLWSPSQLPEEILLVTINSETTQSGEWTPALCAKFVTRLIEAGAQIVVLDLPGRWAYPTGNLDAPMRNLLEHDSEKIVLSIRTGSVTGPGYPVLPIYNHYLPFDDERLEPLVPPEQVFGFLEREPEPKGAADITQPARRAALRSQFVPIDDPQRIQVFKLAAILALEKWLQLPSGGKEPNPFLATHRFSALNTIQINFWGPTGTFPNIPLTSFCGPNAAGVCIALGNRRQFERVENKIVLIGFTGEENPEALPMRSPFGDSMPAVEIQANVLASLMTGLFYRTIPRWFQVGVMVAGSVLVGWLATTTVTQMNRKPWSWQMQLGLGAGLGYVGACILAFGQQLVLPITQPVLSWIATGASVALCMLLWQRQRLYEMEQRQLAERQAVLIETRKLLHRVATDIHDGPLQELKLVMDRIELLQFQQPTLDVNAILDGLERVGVDLREQLNSTRSLADKLEVTPELHGGLDQGIHQQLRHLVASGALKLKVIEQLRPLREPLLNGSWISAREDVFRFFREAIANVIRHAQPPNGTATQVTVSLWRSADQCTLVIENDGAQIPNSVPATLPRQHGRGGYGTKLMTTIAADLPDGSWERVALVNGGMRVQLTWTLKFDQPEINRL